MLHVQASTINSSHLLHPFAHVIIIMAENSETTKDNPRNPDEEDTT